MNNYVKSIKIKFNAEMSSIKKMGRDFKSEFEKDVKLDFDGKKLYERMKKLSDEFTTRIKDLFKSAWAELDNILGYSKLSNKHTRDLAFSYGLTGSQAYGYDKAMGMLGFDDIEDLQYANQQELSQFRELFTKYTNKYEKLYDSGFFAKLQEYEVEMKDFQEELKLEVVEFLMENKDLIKDGMSAIMSLAKIGLQILDILAGLFRTSGGISSSERSAATADIISNYSTNKSISVNVDNTYNHVSSADREWLNNVGQMTYGQIINVLREGY